MMKWFAAWITFSCVVVPVCALAFARLREAKRWTVYPGNSAAESTFRPSLVRRPESLIRTNSPMRRVV